MSISDPMAAPTGIEFIVDAYGCRPSFLASRDHLASIAQRIVEELQLQPLGEPLWHEFPQTGGVTGLILLTTSHLSVHTFPERGFAAFNLYCCSQPADWPWEDRLRELLNAEYVSIRTCVRGRSPSPASEAPAQTGEDEAAAPLR